MTEEKSFDEGAVEYGEIPLVLDRWGVPLLQVKDQKAGNVRLGRKRKPSKAIAKVQAPFSSVVDDNDDGNGSNVTPSALTLDDEHASENVNRNGNEDGSGDGNGNRSRSGNANANTNKSAKENMNANANENENTMTLMPRQKPRAAPITRPLVNYSSSGIMPFTPDMAQRKQVQFALMLAAEISSETRLPEIANEIREAKIRKLRAELDALEGDTGLDLHGSDFQGYQCVDVSMPQHHGALPLPEIVLCQSKRDGLLQRPVHIRKDTGVSRISPMSFYDRIAMPPSARGGKFKPAFPGPFANRTHMASHSPSSSMRKRVDNYLNDRYLDEGTAGPSRQRYL